MSVVSIQDFWFRLFVIYVDRVTNNRVSSSIYRMILKVEALVVITDLMVVVRFIETRNNIDETHKTEGGK